MLGAKCSIGGGELGNGDGDALHWLTAVSSLSQLDVNASVANLVCFAI